MPIMQDEDGDLWEVDAQGNPIRMVSRGGSQQQMPADPGFQYKGRAAELDIQGKEANLGNDAARLNLDRQRFELQQRQAEAAAREAATKQGTTQARGGVDSTESERTAGFLATRLAGGLQDLSNIGNIGAPSLKDALVGGTLIGNYTTDELRQRAINAQRDILDAALTLGTGAAYTKEQIEAYRASYFPQPGDAPGTVKDKGVRLQRLLEASRLKAGASAGMIDEALSRANTAAPDPNADDPNNPGMTNDGSLSVRVTDDRPDGPPQPSTGGDYRDSYLGQGMSGVNEGIANTFGLPVDVMTAVGNLVPKGINAIANTNIPTIDKPVAGSDWIKDQMSGWGTYAPTKDGGKQFIRRVGQSVGGALVPAGATASTARQFGGAMLGAAGGGVGGASAQQAFPGNPVAEFAGELAGGGLTGAGTLAFARRGAQRQIESAIPTVDQLKEQAGNLYRQAESRGVTADPGMTQDLADQLRQVLSDDGRISPTGRISEVYPKAKEAIQLADDYAGKTMTPTQLQTVRKVMADGMASPDSTDRRIASMLTDTFDEWANPQAPELAQARDISSRYLNAQQLERARELAGARASQFTGSGFENALRTEYRALDRNVIKGKGRYGPAVTDAIENVSRGTPLSNAARSAGRFAPTGPMSTGLGVGIPAAVGAALGGPAGAVIAGGGAAGIGTLGRVAATRMGIRNADVAELIARNGGPIDQAPLVDADTQKAIAALLVAQQGPPLNAPRKSKRKQR